MSTTTSSSSSSSSVSPPQTPYSSTSATHHHQVRGYPYGSPTYPECRQGPQGPQVYDSYVVPWAQSQPQIFHYNQTQQNQSNSPFMTQTQTQTQSQPFLQPQYPQHTSGYSLPRWANTPGYFTGRKQ
ncbi:MAG: hypothetical protein Q8872_02685, partial [Candidatus Phytoplasma australasiaticum]|nr:hypothetical protein [Candidatus Phytoplasma australasiaticum]